MQAPANNEDNALGGNPGFLEPRPNQFFNAEDNIGLDDNTPDPVQEAVVDPANEAVEAWIDEPGGDTFAKIPVPTFGGIMRTTIGSTSHVFAWTGIDPDLKANCYSWDQNDPGAWVIPVGSKIPGALRMKGPPHDGMYRPTGLKYERTTRVACSTYKPVVKFNGLAPADGKIAVTLRDYKESIRRHLVTHGMFSEFLVPNPAGGDKLDTVRFHSKITKEQMAAHVSNLKATGDRYIIQNLGFSGDLIRDSLSPEPLGKLLREVSIDASGPDSFAALMRITHSDSYPAMQKVKRELENIKLSNYKGEDVEACCDDILMHCDQLDAAGALVPDLLCTIVQIFEGSQDHRLMTWAMARYEKTSARVRYLHSMQMGVEFGDPEHYTTLCSDVTTQWRSQVDSNRWTVSSGHGKPTEPALPAGYMAGGCLPTGNEGMQFQAFAAAMLKHMEFSKRNQGGGTGGGKCHNCGKEGHHARACPNPRSGTTGHPPRPDWKNTLAPGDDPNTATRAMNGRVYKWCATCGFFIFHHKDGHAAWAERRAAANGGSAPPAANAMAALAQLQMDQDEAPRGITDFFA